MKGLMGKTSFVIVFILSISLFGGCNLKSDNDKQSISKQDTINDTKKSPAVKLDWYIQGSWYNKKWDSKITMFDKIVTEKTGVDLNIIIPSSDSDENLIAMAASGELPDIMTIDNWNGVREQMIKSGHFQPLNKLAEKYSPELLDIIPESMKKWLTREDGNWYAISNYFTAPEWMPEGSSIENANGIIARKDLMDKLGIMPEDFRTQDGAIEVFKKVKAANLSYNGKPVLPFYIQWNDWSLARMWGIPWETADGNLIDLKTHPKYVELYKFLNRLWREGLLSEDNFTVWAGEKIEQGVCFAYMGNLDYVSEPMSKIYNADNQALYEPVGPLHALDGAEPLYDQAGTGWTSTFITKKCKYPEAAIKLLTFLSSDEGQMLTWYGVEGKTYKIVNGKVQYTNEYLRMKREDPEMAQKVYGINDFWPLKQPLFNERYADKESLPEADKNYKNIVKYFSKYTVNTPETMGTNPDQGTPEAGMMQKIYDYWQKQTRKMVLARTLEEVDEIYKESINNINTLGYQRVYKASNNKFQAQKEKMSKKFSYPQNKK